MKLPAFPLAELGPSVEAACLRLAEVALHPAHANRAGRDADDADADSPHAHSAGPALVHAFLVDLFEAQHRHAEAAALCGRLGTDWDAVRAAYWRYRQGEISSRS